MRLPFLDRKSESKRIRRALKAGGGALVVVYGRRRCGKSRLLQQVARREDVYYLADQSEAPLQRDAFAAAVERVMPGFAGVRYPTWESMFSQIEQRTRGKVNVFLDEFPYVVKESSELPSAIQRHLDLPGPKRMNLVLSGSSQRMMHGLVLDGSAPLYGRAAEILKIEPMQPGWIQEALGLAADKAVEAYGIWGGVPRYWEAARDYRNTREAIVNTVLDKNGVFYDEPMRILADDMRSAVQPYSILRTIAVGCHRLSEIAGRLGKPANSLSRPLAQLVDLGYVSRDIPWGESPKSTRRSLYRVSDPFLQFYFRFVQPARSALSMGLNDLVWNDIEKLMNAHTGGVWEELARRSVPFVSIGGKRWRPASRWWGSGTDGQRAEFDVVAESEDRKSLLVGEAKWTSRSGSERLCERLMSKARTLPAAAGRNVVIALWLKKSGGQKGASVIGPKTVMNALV